MTTAEERTYENPGDCIKCGQSGGNLRWTEAARYSDGTPLGTLFATCRNCGYEWPVLAKDDAGRRER